MVLDKESVANCLLVFLQKVLLSSARTGVLHGKKHHGLGLPRLLLLLLLTAGPAPHRVIDVSYQ